MFDNLNKFIFKTSMIIFFVSAISLFLLIQENNNELFSLAEKEYFNDKNLIVKSYDNKNKEFYGYEIIVMIISGLDFDIEIEGEYINKNDNNKGLNLSFISEEKIYILKMDIDETGEIKCIRYISE